MPQTHATEILQMRRSQILMQQIGTQRLPFLIEQHGDRNARLQPETGRAAERTKPRSHLFQRFQRLVFRQFREQTLRFFSVEHRVVGFAFQPGEHLSTLELFDFA